MDGWPGQLVVRAGEATSENRSFTKLRLFLLAQPQRRSPPAGHRVSLESCRGLIYAARWSPRPATLPGEW